MKSEPDLLKPLRGMYLAQLRERAESVKAFLTHATQGGAGDEERLVLRGVAHKLAGSGTTFGFPLITQTARAVEAAIDTDEPPAKVAALTESLLSVCEQVLLSVDRGAEESLKDVNLARTHDLRPSILTVDDDAIVHEVLSTLFREDYHIQSAHNGEEALRMLRANKPQLLLLDENMPGMSGLELLRALRADAEFRDIPVVMLTAKDHSADVVDAVSAGAIDYVVKPFKPDDLLAKVRSLLHRSGKSVLIADDDGAIRDLLAYKFRMAGLRVFTATDGEEALSQATLHHPDLAILDRMMPGLDGIAVLQQMRADERMRGIPVIFLTAMRQERDILEGFRLGASDYVIKPFLPEEVLARGLRLLGVNPGSL